jgi:hypothetical protein
MSDFYKYFKENMDALNLPAPENLYGSVATAQTSISGMLVYIDKYGTRVTVLDMIGAGTNLERLATVGAVQGAYYIGAAIGSLAVATGRTLAAGTSLSDVLFEASHRDLKRDWLLPLLHRNPGIYVPSRSGRKYHKLYENFK